MKLAIVINKLALNLSVLAHAAFTKLELNDFTTGHIFAKAGFSRKQEDINLFMKELALKYPKRDVYIIWDNLNTHLPYQWVKFNEKQKGRFHFIYTPKHASWMNQIEIWLSILQRKEIKNCSFKTVFDLCSKMMDFVSEWNEVAHPFKWKLAGYV